MRPRRRRRDLTFDVDPRPIARNAGRADAGRNGAVEENRLDALTAERAPLERERALNLGDAAPKPRYASSPSTMPRPAVKLYASRLRSGNARSRLTAPVPAGASSRAKSAPRKRAINGARFKNRSTWSSPPIVFACNVKSPAPRSPMPTRRLAERFPSKRPLPVPRSAC